MLLNGSTIEHRSPPQVRTEQQRQKEEAEKRLHKYIRQLDHYERARREEELPLLQEAHKKQVQRLEVILQQTMRPKVWAKSLLQGMV